MEKENYQRTELEIFIFKSEDVITTSNGSSGQEYIGPYIPIDDGE